ncbi:uncharacterized protein TNIN_472501 [Trichonephila inaurata madagascariensis]|uniref:Uncharacterized protein n=1 Tax=Trichonephila inaurata madagascariensis TaxID=2747483 RepID=A0A8X7BWT9_9ARAC|nr:uncharacterized protein TNIN_472501 [Trichonephila inaurata madagascariensis]
MFKVGTCAVFVLLFCLVKIAEGQKPPRAYAKAKCEKRIKNETQLEQCKICVEQYNLPEYPSKSENPKILILSITSQSLYAPVIFVKVRFRYS